MTLTGQKGKFFQNWAKTFSCTPELYFEPKSIDELKDIVKLGRDNKKKIKVIGFGHSPSSIACTNDYMVSLKYLDSVIDVDKENCKIKVEGGILLTKLNKVCEDNDMAISVLGSVSDQTIAGTISCGTHGTGINYGIIASYISEIEVLHMSGEIVTYSRTKNSELFPAFLCSLGALGIIVRTTLQCETFFKLEDIQYPAKLGDVLTSLGVYTKASDHFRFLWYPHTDEVICYQTSRTTKPISNKSNWFMNYAIGYYLLEFLYYISGFWSNLIPLISRVYYKLNSRPKETVDKCYNIFNFECLFKQYVFEAAIPISKTAEFLLDLKTFLENNPSVKAHFPVEVRFVKGDDIWLSPSYQQDSCYINIIMYRPYGKFIPYAEWWNCYEKAMEKCNGRPHWAKAHNYRKTKLESIYPKFKDFNQLRKTLDPDELLINDYLKTIFTD